MKTPREILLAQHRAAGPKLDAIRHDVVSALNNQETKSPVSESIFVSSFLGCSKKMWDELVLPSRRIWSGLAAVWLLIIVVNVSQRDHSPVGKVASAPVLISAREQQRLMNELFADRTLPVEAEPPKTFSPKPHTQTFQTFAT